MKIANFTNKNNIIIFLLIIIIILSIIFYLFDTINIEAQQHLNQIYTNTQHLQQKYGNLINKNPEIISENGIYIINNVLHPDFFQYLKTQFDNKSFASKNAYFRKGTGINFFDLHNNKDYTGLLEFYYSTELLDLLSRLFEKPIQKPSLSDTDACSLLIYANKGDFIDWHKDHSLYNGDRFVVLLTIVNENADKNGLSQNEFIYTHEGQEYPVKLQENSIIVFKGSEVLHKSTGIDENERRILLSMTFCDICQEKKNIIQFVYEKIKHLVIYQ
jgi:hypothetical protein